MTHAYLQEIPQVADGKRYRYPKPHTGNQDIGSPDRVGCGLYSDWRKLRLGVQAHVQLSGFFFSFQVTSLVSIIIFMYFGPTGIADIFLPVGIQLVVRNNF